ncbi:MAG: hypothetical protein ACRDRM_06280, partial [Pseudonocardiaceae bacterium]
MTSVPVVLAGAALGLAAGAGGALLLRRIPRGVRVAPLVCAAMVSALWATVGALAGELPPWW